MLLSCVWGKKGKWGNRWKAFFPLSDLRTLHFTAGCGFGEKEGDPPHPLNVQDDARWAKRCHIFTGGDALICVDALFSSMYATFFFTLLHPMPRLSWRTKKHAPLSQEKKQNNQSAAGCGCYTNSWLTSQQVICPTRRRRNNQHSAWFSPFHPPELFLFISC